MSNDASFGDFSFALRVMNAIKTRIADEIESLRPDYRYATVTSIDYVSRTVRVQYPEDSDDFAVKLGSRCPWRTGQKVRIGGREGDKHIIDVMGPTTDTPPGQVMWFVGPTIPPGWLVCDGSSYDPTVYTELYQAIGTTWGGTTTVPLLPDMSNAFPRQGTPGSGGGSTSHSHTLSNAGAAKIYTSGSAITSGNVATASWTDTNLSTLSGAASSATRVTGSGLIGSTDANSTFLPPYKTGYFAIRY